jgi:hypothetical protein
MAVRVDGRAMSPPAVIIEPILGGLVVLSGGFAIEQARDVVDRLLKGAAKIEFEVVPN